jgi:hypothetical protein
LLIVSPVRQPFWPQSGRNSTYPAVQILRASSDTALREENGTVNPLGLYDLDRNIRAVGRSYRQLIHDWYQVLPAQSVCLQFPIIAPRDFDKPFAQRARKSMKWICDHTPSEPLMSS